MTDITAAADTTQTTAAAPTTTAAPAPAVDQSTTAAASTSLLGATETTAALEGTPPAAETTTAPASADPEAPQGAPETYDFKAPEGTVLDESVVGEFSAVAKELGLPQDAAQKIIDKLAPKIAERNTQAMQDAVATYRADLVAQVKADKEIGGDKLAENLAIADKAVKAYGSPELRKLFNETGLGDHPAVIRAFYKMGMDISNAAFVPGGKQPSKGETDAASKLYGK